MEYNPFPNGLESWMQTNRVVCKFVVEKKASLTSQCKVSDVFSTMGEDGLIDLITEWTNKFEQRYSSMSSLGGEQQDRFSAVNDFLVENNYI